MTTPLSIPPSDQSKVSPTDSTSTLPPPETTAATDTSPNLTLNESPAGLSQSQQPVAGPSRPNTQRPSLPNLNLPTNALNGFNALAGVNGLSGLNTAGVNGDGQSLQERLASAQQQMQGVQQGMTGGINNDGTPIIGGGQGATAEAMLRQLQAMQASRIRQGQQASLGLGHGNGSLSASSPANPSNPQPAPGESSAQSAPSPASNGPVVNSTGTGPSVVGVQLTQAQKDMLAQHERLRNSSLSSSTGGSPSAPQTPTSIPPSMPNPTNPPQRPPNPQASRAAIANQRQQFVQSLANYYRSNNMALPPEVFNGERDGAVKVLGVWVDLVDLFMTVMRSQGVLNAIKQPADSPTWTSIIGGRGMPNPFPEPLQIPRPPNAPPNMPTAHTTNPVQYLVGVYIAFVKGFEDDMTRRRNFAAQNRAAPAGARPPAGQSPMTAMSPVATTPAQTSVATPVNAPPTPMNAATPSAQTPTTALPTAPTPTAQAQTTLPSATPNPVLPSSTPVSATTAQVSKPVPQAPSITQPPSAPAQSSDLNPLASDRRTTFAPPPIDTAVASAASVPGENVSATPLTGEKRKLSETINPDTQTSLPVPAPKRPRYKVEYKPIHLPMTGLAGWDERAVVSTFPNRNLAHASRSIHDLAVVDMEAILMGLRSRLPRELGYAITALSMLSMPHPEDSLDGLPLAHLVEVFTELVCLLEEAAFGDDGYKAWDEKVTKRSDQPEIDIADMSLMAWEQIGRHVDISLSDDLTGSACRKDKTGGSTDVILSVLNLLRNFSLFEDNHQLMGRHPDLMSTLARIIDPRLVRVPGWSTNDEPYSYIEYGTVTRDVLMILTNVGRFCDLRDESFASVQAIYRLIARTLKSGIELCNWKESPYDTLLNTKYNAIPAITTIYRAAEALYCIAGSDVNREVLGRISEDELVGLFESLVKLLPVTQRQLNGLRTVDTHLVYFECLGLGLYSLAFLSPLTARAKMRAIPGACTVIRRIITDMMPLGRTFPHNPLNVICRRLAETLGVLNGTATCTGEGGTSRTMGFSASSGEGKGWRWASGTIESGWMAGDEEKIMECLMVHGVDKNMFAELDALWWADNE